MKIENVLFDEFLKNFYSGKGIYENFDQFVLRVRKKSEKDDKNDYENIAYYNGIKAFTIKNQKDHPVLLFPINVYKCNSKDIENSMKEEGISPKQAVKNYYSNLKALCKAMNSFFDFSMQTIQFILNKISFDDELFQKRLEEYRKKTIQYGNNPKYHCNSDFDVFYDESNLKCKLVFKEKILNSNVIIMFQKYFLCLFKYENLKNPLVKDVEFKDYQVQFNEEKVLRQQRILKKHGDDKTVLDLFVTNMKNAIQKYTGKVNIEKKYQHQFLLHGANTNIFELEPGEKLEHFEQEYGIYNLERDKTGRIDAIFYKYKIQNQNVLITGIYLVELKVDSKVVLKNNGVLTHLDDIREFLNFDGTKCPKYAKYDLDHLKTRIMDRIEMLTSFKREDIEYSKDLTIHFYTVIGFTKDEEREVVSDMMLSLCDLEKMKTFSSQKLDPYFALHDYNLQSVCPSKSQCEVRFYFEKGLFVNDKIGSDFEDKTKEFLYL